MDACENISILAFSGRPAKLLARLYVCDHSWGFVWSLRQMQLFLSRGVSRVTSPPSRSERKLLTADVAAGVCLSK